MAAASFYEDESLKVGDVELTFAANQIELTQFFDRARNA
jgi:hypothetical protein